MKSSVVSLVFGLLFASQALGQSRGLPVIDVTRPPFNAIPNDGGDDTTGIQLAIDEAEVYASTSADARAMVVFPRGIYEITGLVIDNPRIILHGYGASLELRTHALVGSNYNQMLWIKGEADGDDAEQIEIYGLTFDANYPTVNNSGTGVGLNIRGNKVKLVDVVSEYTENTTFVSASCDQTTYTRCISNYAGISGFRARGDNQTLVGCRAYNWNAINQTNGSRAIIADGQEIDAESLLVDDFFGQMTEARAASDGILVDCGDGDRQGSNTVACGNSGQATNNRGKAQWTIDAGHGFERGDGFKIQESGVTAYDGTVTTDSISHKIIEVTGEVFVYVVDANTLKLYKTATDAKEGAGGSTNRYDLTNFGTGTFYIKSAGGLNKIFTVANTTDDTITCSNHRFQTGKAARLTVDTTGVDFLPGGLRDAALITVNTAHQGNGTGAKYWRPKRLKNVTLRNVRFDINVPTTEDTNVVKVNNVNNLVVDRLEITQAPTDADDNPSSCALRIGQGCRKVTVLHSVLPNGFINNTRSWIPDLTIGHTEIGTSDLIPQIGIRGLQVGKFSLYNSTVRCSLYCMSTSEIAQGLRDADCETWDIHDNVFEGNRDTDRTRVLAVNDGAHISHSGIVKFYNNTRLNPAYLGMTFTAAVSDTITTSTIHNLDTGDEVYISNNGTGALPLGLNEGKYFIRRTGSNTLTLHTDAPGASDNTLRADVQDLGSGTQTMYSHKLGMAITNTEPRDRGFMQKGSSGREFIGIAAPTNNSFEHKAGDIVWNMNPASGATPGWVCTKTGVQGSTLATFVAMDPLP